MRTYLDFTCRSQVRTLRASYCAHVCIGFNRGSSALFLRRPFADLVEYHLVARLCLIVLVVLVLDCACCVGAG